MILKYKQPHSVDFYLPKRLRYIDGPLRFMCLLAYVQRKEIIEIIQIEVGNLARNGILTHT